MQATTPGVPAVGADASANTSVASGPSATTGSGSSSNLRASSSRNAARKQARKAKRRGSALMMYALFFGLVVAAIAVYFGGGLSLSNISLMSSVSFNRKLVFNKQEVVLDIMSIDSLFDSLKSEQERARPLRLNRVAIGYNSNLDMVVGASQTLIPFLRSTIGKKELEDLSTTIDHAKITNVRQLAEAFAYHFVQGVAAERFIEDPTLFSEIISFILREVDTQYYQFHPGGNAALMGNKFGDLGIKVLLGGAVGPRLKNLLQPNVVPLAKYHMKEEHQQQNDEDDEDEQGMYKELQKDEIHLIIEFEKGAKWKLSADRILESPRANRFIVSHDVTNSHLLALEPFHSSLYSFDEELVVLTGTHLCEAINHKLDVLHKVVEHVTTLTSRHKQVVHFELASVGDQGFFEIMTRSLVPKVDSIGLNEQELYTLYLTARNDEQMNGVGEQLEKATFGGHTLSLDTAISALKTVLTWEKSVMKGRLSRVHLHSLAFHAICQLNSSGADYYKWSSDRAISAVAAGSLATTYQACASDKHRPAASILEVHNHVFEPHQFSEVITIELETYGSERFETNYLFGCYIAPVLICKTPIRTVGLGDTISATGLAYHF